MPFRHSSPAIIGVLLAAGRGRRMGQTKQLINWAVRGTSRPLVAWAFDAIVPVCDDMVVVLGHNALQVADALAPRKFRVVHSDPDAPMFESVRAGLRLANNAGAAADVLLHLADHPQVAPSTLDAILAARAQFPGKALMPEYLGRGGHPALIPARLIDDLVAAASSGGLRQYWLEHPHLCHRLPTDDAGVVHDIDTPDSLPANFD